MMMHFDDGSIYQEVLAFYHDTHFFRGVELLFETIT